MHSQSNFFHRGTVCNLGTLFYISLRLKLLYWIGRRSLKVGDNGFLRDDERQHDTVFEISIARAGLRAI